MLEKIKQLFSGAQVTSATAASKKQPYTGKYPDVSKIKRGYYQKGDKGAEITNLQNYLNWYTDGEFFKKCGKADGIYGNNTLTYTKKMQTAFFGAKEADGSVGPKTVKKMKAYSDSFKPQPKPEPTPSKKYTGKLPTYRLKKTNAQVKADAIAWAKWIAGNNKFHYGYGDESHHNGCFFCGTQDMKKGHGILDPDYTYCCNPFVGAAWAHGGGDAQAYKMCHNYSSWDFGTGGGSYHTSSLFDNLGHPKKSSLKPGDVLCNSHHVALYIGDNKIAEAGHEDNNVRNSSSWNSSIGISNLSDSRYEDFPRAYRYNGSVDADRPLSHGEVSTRVAYWQEFLDWYYNGKVGKPYEGIFGDNTLKWTKKFQEEVLGKGQGDGWVGQKTIEAAKKKANQVTPTPTPTPTPSKTPYKGAYPTIAEIQKASQQGIYNGIALWANEIAASGKYKYKSWTDDPNTHKCPICHPGTGNGWNCIGFAFAGLHHGGGLSTECNCGVIWNGLGDKYVDMSDAAVLADMKKRIGTNAIQLIRNNNKGIPSSKLQKGDLLMFFNPDFSYQHMGIYVGNDKIADSTSGRNPNIKYGSSYSSYNNTMPCLFAIRYTGNRNYLKKDDQGTAVTKLQNYVDWYFDGKFFKECGPADGYFGNNTHKWVVKMQTDFFGAKEADGTVGSKTIEKMKAYSDSLNPQPKPEPTKKPYSGAYPIVDRKKLLVDMAVKLAWPAGTSSSVYKYPGGSGNAAFKNALDKVYPEHNNWGAAPRVGASCDVYAGVVIRAAQIDSKYPRGLEQQFEWKPNWADRYTYSNIAPGPKSQDGDIVLFSYNGGAHTVIRGNGVYYEANYNTYFGHTNTSMSRLNSRQNDIVILRPRNYLSKGDSGPEVTKLQKYVDWYFDGAFFKECGPADGFFGANTDKWVKKMQTKLFSAKEADGLVGAKTIEKMKAVKK